MSKTNVFDANSSTTTEIDQSNESWLFVEHFLFSTSTGNVIHQGSTFSQDTISVDGTVYTSAVNATGVLLEGTNSTLTIGASGSIQAYTGISAAGADLTVQNDGIVLATGFSAAIAATGANAHIINNGTLYGLAGILAQADKVSVENNGTIHSSLTAIVLDSDGGKIVLGEDSILTASTTAISVTTALGQKSTVINNGLIAMKEGTAYAGDGDLGNETLINHGTIRGDVTLGAGNDTFNNMDGMFAGMVSGGAGNDTFIIHSAKTKIVENAGQGDDAIKSTVSISLVSTALSGSEIEDVRLLGTKNLHATGNALGNEITGNNGDNVIDGGAGLDILKGGKGADIFVFATGNGTDDVVDFSHGADRIDLSGTGIKNFKDLMQHHLNEDVGKHAVYIDDGTDEMILDHAHKADLDASQFIF